MPPAPRELRCKICQHDAEPFGSKHGKFLHRDFALARCPGCGFVFVVEPCTDYAKLYDERYYEGRGADPFVDYASELASPDRVIRVYEWRGIVELVRHQVGSVAGKRWLDYGCGAGGLVRFARREGAECVGFDTGAYAPKARAAGIEVLGEAELDAMEGSFDIVTMIEVLEHIVDPLPFLAKIAKLLRPGGVLFLTTGNAEPQVKSFDKWSYAIPEIHVSYFTPRALEIALAKVGLEAQRGRYGAGWTDIIRFKILKTLRVRERSPAEALLPWPVLSRLADRRFGVTAHPLGLKR